MNRCVLVVDVGRGQEAMVFGSQSDAETYLARHPEVEDFAQGIIPIATQTDIRISINKGVRSMNRFICLSCSYETDVRVDIKNHAAILGHFGWRDTKPTRTGWDTPLTGRDD